MLNLTTVANQHTSQGTKLSQHTYQTTRTNRCEPNSADTPTKLSTPTNVELNDCWCELNNLYTDVLPSTKFNRHTHRPVSNSTDIYIWHTNWFMGLYSIPTLANQHSSPGTILGRHTYQLNAPTNVELNNCNRSTFLPRYRTQLTHLPNYTHQQQL